MSAYVGDFRTGKTIRKMWNSNAIAGESITRATNGTVSVYKDGGTTQSTAGVTDTEDFDGLTGVHLVAIDTSADGTFYSAGSDFEVVLSAATIDGKTINATLFSFSLEARSALLPTTDGRKLDVSAGGEAGLDWANVGSPTTTVNLSGTTVKTATDVETDTADIQSRIGSPVSSLAADGLSRFQKLSRYIWLMMRKDAAIATDFATELLEINADNGSGLGAFSNTTESQEALRDRGDAAWITATGFSTLSQADIRTAIGLASANLDTQIGDLPTNAELATALASADDAVLAAIAALNNLSSAQAQTAAAAALVAIHLDHLLAEAYDPTSKPGNAAGLLNVLIENDGGVPQFTANALEEAPSGGGAGGGPSIQ